MFGLDLGVLCWNREICFIVNDLKFCELYVLRYKYFLWFKYILFFLGNKTENGIYGDNIFWIVVILWYVFYIFEIKCYEKYCWNNISSCVW